MIASIGPRLIDPKSKTAQFLSIFRYAEEKSQVEEILKARAQNLNATLFTKSDSTARMVGRGGRGPGGRSSFMGGRGGRGTSKSNLEHSDSLFTPKSRNINASVDSDDGRDMVTSGVDNVFSVLDQLEGQNKGHQTSKYNFSASQSVINLDTITEDEPEDPITSGLKQIEIRPENSSPATDLELSTTNSSPSIPTSHEFVKQEPAPFAEERVLLHTKSENEIIHVKSVTASNLDKLFEEIPSIEEELGHDSNSGSAPGSTYNIKPSFNQPQKSASAVNVLSSATFDVNDKPAPNTVKRFTQIFSTKPSSNTNNVKTTEHLDDLKAVRAIRSRRHSEFTYPSQSTVPLAAVATTSHRASLNLGQDLASKCALALFMTKEEFLCLDRHEPVRVIDGIPKFTYRELVRRNYIKDYGELAQNELEKHLVDEEFNPVFGRDKVKFILFKNCICKSFIFLFCFVLGTIFCTS